MRRLTMGLGAAALMVMNLPCLALDGYFNSGFGTKSKGMAGASVALALDALAPATNPAALVALGDRTDLTFAIFNPVRGFSAEGNPSGACASATQCTFGLAPRARDSKRDFFPVPGFGIVRQIDARSAWGIAAYANGGLNTEYVGGQAIYGTPAGPVPPGTPVTSPGVYGAGDAGVDLSQLFLSPSYARRIGDRVRLGLAPIVAMERFAAKGLGTFAPYSSSPGHLSDRGHDYSFGGGIRIGIQGELTSTVAVGASWQSRLYMSRFRKYAGLFAEHGSLDVPSNYTVGLAVKPRAGLTLALDLKTIQYGQIRAISNRLLPNLATSKLGDTAGPGFGWNDMRIVKVGMAFEGSGGRTYRLGYSYGSTQIPASAILFTLLAPAVTKHHLTAGLSQKLRGDRELSLSLNLGLRSSIKGRNPLDPAQTIKSYCRVIDLELGYGWGR